MPEKREYQGPFEVRGRRTDGAAEELLSVHSDREMARTLAEDACSRQGFASATIYDRPTQDAVESVKHAETA